MIKNGITETFLAINESKIPNHLRTPFYQSNEQYALLCMMHEVKCNCGKNHIGEKGRNVTLTMKIVT